MHFLKDNSIVAALSAPTISSRKRKANRHDHIHDRQFLRCLGYCERTMDQYKEPCPKMQQGSWGRVLCPAWMFWVWQVRPLCCWLSPHKCTWGVATCRSKSGRLRRLATAAGASSSPCHRDQDGWETHHCGNRYATRHWAFSVHSIWL